MISTFICRHCGLTCRCNPHIKNQKYCSSLTCQNARKRMHDKRTNATLRGKSSQKVRNKEWRANRPAHEYQKNYRDTHPEYVKRNRDLQRERNKKRQNAQTPMIVKTDALSLRPLCDGTYMAFEIKNGKIVKTDALLLQMETFSDKEAFYPANPG